MGATTSHTEASMLQRLRRHLGKQGDQHALVIHPRSAAGFDARRTLDAMSMSLWPSRGLLIDGWEVKVSRSDWLRELREAQKAEAFANKVDRFWLLVGDRKIVKDGELPPDWGLMYAHGDGLRTLTAAKLLRPATVKRGHCRPLPPDFERSFLAAVLREAVREGDTEPAAVRSAVDAEMERYRIAHERSERSWQRMYEDLNDRVRAFEQGLGTTIRHIGFRDTPQDVGRAVRALVSGDHEIDRLAKRARDIAKTAESIAEDAKKQADALETVLNGDQSVVELDVPEAA